MHNQQPNSHFMGQGGVSVIICTYNREKYIYNVLKSVAENDFPTEKYEILLINNNCTDRTESECQRFAADFPHVNFRTFVEKDQGLSHARNRGIRESKGEILVYVDDDAVVNSDYLRTFYDFFAQNSDAFAAGGPIIPRYETEKPKWMTYFVEQLLTGRLYEGEKVQEFTGKSYPGGGNAAYRKQVFEKIGFYNVELGRKGDSLVGAEEKDIFNKMRTQKMRFFYLPNAILYHIIPEKKLTIDYFDRLTYSIGVSERKRTKSISTTKFLERILAETVKWAATFVLFLFYLLQFSPQKGIKLIIFRKNVTKGLLGK